MRRRKICVITGSRAEFGLLYWLLKEIKFDKNLKLQLVATGMHLSPDFGLTYKEIEKDFIIDKKIYMDLSKDDILNIQNSMALAQVSFLKAYQELKPDIVVILGDRYEIFSAAMAAMFLKIPIAHIHGGELTQGSWDDAIRHCITKMSQIHFTAAKEYAKRVIQLGEEPARVFDVGGLGIENIKKLPLLDKNQLEKSINFKLNRKNLLITFHPETLEIDSSKNQFQELLNAIMELENTNFIFTKSNSDPEGRIINQMIDNFVKQNPERSVGFFSLGQLRYLSILQYVDAVLGNSSSGLIEVPSFKIGTINIGDRQKGRIKAKSIIDCKPLKKNIQLAIKKIYSKKFKNTLKSVKNPYDKGPPSKKIIKIIKSVKIQNLIKKKFYDINFNL